MKTRKYDCDGILEHIDPSRIRVGNVVRMASDAWSMPAFSSSVVLQIKVVYSDGSYTSFDNLGEVPEVDMRNGRVSVGLGRPYMYVTRLGNPLTGLEIYEAPARSFLDNYRVVVLSTGEYASFVME